MNNLRKSIELIFQYWRFEDEKKNGFPESFNVRKAIKSNPLIRAAAIDIFEKYSLNEIESVLNKLCSHWLVNKYQDGVSTHSVFNVLFHFTNQVIEERNQEPFVRYPHLLKWRDISFKLGEDLFTCSYLAMMDNRSSRSREFFAWRPHIFSTNIRLRQMLRQGMSENHFHLKGSAPIFELSWIAIMNKPSESIVKFKDLSSQVRLSPNKNYTFKGGSVSLEQKVYRAIKIRLTLFDYLINNKSISHDLNEDDLIPNIDQLSKDIQLTRYLNGYSFSHLEGSEIADYAIPKSITEKELSKSKLLVGERKFLYLSFKRIYESPSDNRLFETLFHQYLVIKSQFRSELIQVNNKIGFSNFFLYQNRKELFIPKGSIYETAIYNMAVNDTLVHQNINSLELRVAPKNNVVDLYESLKNICRKKSSYAIRENRLKKDLYFCSGEEEKDFFVLHFIKKADQFQSNTSDTMKFSYSRHHKLRTQLKNQARAIVELRESAYSEARKIRGIDAASSEFDARPEVFAQVFRYLKDHKLKGFFSSFDKKYTQNKLFATFHAGEDFFDIIDGLRTIDEAIKFLKLRQGDRIGHALALGINAQDFYSLKGKELMIPKGVLLDNLAWLIAMSRKFQIDNYSSEIQNLEKLFEALFQEVYLDHFDGTCYESATFGHSIYYDSWKLRGDDPMLYRDHWQKDVELIPNITYWERCRVNHFYPKNGTARKNERCKFLYHMYHFSPGVKNSYEEIKQFEISENYIKIVEATQKSFMFEIMKLNIGIECNPTSNYLIGTFDKYENHPIKEFYNLGLETDPDTVDRCPQLFVSINTDDQGVFGTSLENEYALMAIAMEKAKKDDGSPKYKPTMIYNWLDNIRKMGNEQSFLDNNERTN